MDRFNSLENKISTWTVLSLDVKTLGWKTPFTWCGLYIGQYVRAMQHEALPESFAKEINGQLETMVNSIIV